MKLRDPKTGNLSSQVALTFLAVSLLPLGAALLLTYLDGRHTLSTEILRNLRAIALRQASLVTGGIRARAEDVVVLAKNPSTRAALYEATSSTIENGACAPGTLEQFRDFGADFCVARNTAQVFLIRRDGQILLSTGPAAPTTGSLRSPELADTELARVFERANTVLETEVSDFKIHTPTGVPAAFLAAPVLDYGRVVGVAAIQVGSAQALGAVMDTTGLGTTGETMIGTPETSTTAIIVAPMRHDRNAAFRRKMVMGSNSDVDRGLKLALEGERGFGEFVDYRGQSVLAVWRYLPALRWGIVVKIDQAEALRPVDRMGGTFLAVLLGTALFIMVAAIILGRTLARPVTRLTEVTRRMAQGDFATQVAISSKNEIGELARSFQTMSERLSSAFENLRQTAEERDHAAREANAARAHVEEVNASLEQTVDRRTSELREKNSDLQKTLEELHRTQEQLIAQAKMASLGKLTSGVAHEIKNPLNFVNNFAIVTADLCKELRDIAESIDQRLSQEERADVDDLLSTMEDNLQRIAGHGRRADSIVRGMLDHARTTTSTERHPTNMAAFVTEYSKVALASQEAIAGSHDTKLTFDLGDDIGRIPVYPNDLSRAIINIVANASWAARTKAAHPTTPASFEPTVAISCHRHGERCIIKVRDNGIGISPTDLPRIFEPFFSTKPTGEGTGLGLSLTHDIIVQIHGGQLTVDTRQGEYTEFTIELPADNPSTHTSLDNANDPLD